MPPLPPATATLRRDDYDRFVTTLFAPPADRAALTALYAFAVEVARTRESVREPLLGHMRLQWWRDGLTAARAGGPVPAHPVAGPLAEAVLHRDLDSALFEALLSARAEDLEDTTPSDLAALERYADATSGGLAVLALQILGVRGAGAEQAGRAVGTAYALVGLARAVPFHAAARRCYLPADLCAAAGFAAADLYDGTAPAGLPRVVAALADAAAARLDAARALRGVLPRAALPALLPAVAARYHLERLRRSGGNVFHRRVQHPPTPGRIVRTAAAALTGRY